MGESGLREVGRLVVPAVGAVVEAPGDRVLPVRLVGADGAEVAAVTEFLLDLRACGGSAGSARSYALALLRWFRFLQAVGVAWDRTGRSEARDFMLWLEAARKPERHRAPGSPAPGSVNLVTRKPYPGLQYAVRTRRHNRAVVRAFYEYHREAGSGPLVNPMPAGRGRDAGRASAGLPARGAGRAAGDVAVTAVAEQPVAAGPRGRVAGRESRRGARSLPPAVLPDVPVVLPAGQQVRPDAVSWPQTEASRAEVGARLLEIAGKTGGSLPLHRMSVRRLLDWLEAQPGSTWQQRWQASGAEQAGKDWAAPLAGSGCRGGGTADQDVIKAGMMLLRARLAEAREQGWGGETAGLEVSIAGAGQKLAAMDQLAARHQVTHLGMPDFRPSTGRSSGAEGGP